MAATAPLGLLSPDPLIDTLFTDPDYATLKALRKTDKAGVPLLFDQAWRVVILQYIRKHETFRRAAALLLVFKLYLKIETTETAFPKLTDLDQKSWVKTCLRTIEKGNPSQVRELISQVVAALDKTTAQLSSDALIQVSSDVSGKVRQWCMMDASSIATSPSMTIIDLRPSSERDIEHEAKKALDPENEKYAIEIASLLKAKDSEERLTEEAKNRIREIGQYLGDNGGDERMKKVGYRVQSLGSSSRLL